MKKYLTIFLLYPLLLPGALFADQSSHPYHLFRDSIYNNMNLNCDLQGSSIFYGKVLPVTPIPIYLAPGSTNQFFLVEGNKTGATVRLTYACEAGRKITIISRSDLNFRDRADRVRHSTFNAVDMRAYASKTEQSYLNNMSIINWVFERT